MINRHFWRKSTKKIPYMATLNHSCYDPSTNALCDWPFSDVVAASLTIAMIIVAIITVVCNTTVLSVIFSKPMLQNATGILMFNLAIADLIIGLITMPTLIVTLLARKWVFGYALCSVSGVIQTAMSNLSVCVITGLCLDRYMAVLRPLRYIRYVSRKRVIGYLIIAWLFSILLALVPLFNLHTIGLGRYNFIPSEASCWLYLSDSYNFIIIIITIFLAYTLGIFIVYSLIYQAARRSFFRISDITLSLSPRHDRRVNSKAAKTTLVIVGAFLLCWMPRIVLLIHQVLLKLNHMQLQISPIVTLLLTWLSLINSALNPLIYGTYNRNFRRSVVEILSTSDGRSRGESLSNHHTSKISSCNTKSSIRIGYAKSSSSRSTDH